jgi:hypothetical protein
MLKLTITTGADGRLTAESRARIRSAVGPQLGVATMLGRSFADHVAREVATKAEAELRASPGNGTLQRPFRIPRVRR